MSESTPRPQPIVVKTVCSLCDLPWEAHGEKPTTADCVRLLKDELARRPITNWPVYSFTDLVPKSYPYATYSGTDNYGRVTISGNTISGSTTGNVVRLFPKPDDGDEPMPVTNT